MLRRKIQALQYLISSIDATTTESFDYKLTKLKALFDENSGKQYLFITRYTYQ